MPEGVNLASSADRIELFRYGLACTDFSITPKRTGAWFEIMCPNNAGFMAAKRGFDAETVIGESQDAPLLFPELSEWPCSAPMDRPLPRGRFSTARGAYAWPWASVSANSKYDLTRNVIDGLRQTSAHAPPCRTMKIVSRNVSATCHSGCHCTASTRPPSRGTNAFDNAIDTLGLDHELVTRSVNALEMRGHDHDR